MSRTTRLGLMAGLSAGPLFYVLVLMQIATRDGFSIWVHPISLLALGPGGWVQTLNFALTGLLLLAGGTALVRLPTRRVQGVLLGIAGIGFVIVAINPADPFMNFPPGTVTEPGAPLSRHAQLHGLGFMMCFGAIILAALVTAFTDWRSGFAIASLVLSVLIVAVLAFGMSRIEHNSESFFVLGVLAFGWVSVLCLRALDPAVRQSRQPALAR